MSSLSIMSKRIKIHQSQTEIGNADDDEQNWIYWGASGLDYARTSLDMDGMLEFECYRLGGT